MFSVKKVLILVLLFLTFTPLIAEARFVPTGRDTGENPETYTDIPLADYDALGYTHLTENEIYDFYWQEQRDVLVVVDKRNNYVWKTGLDVDPNLSRTAQASVCKDLKRDYNNDVITYEEFDEACSITVDQITGTTTGPLQANSLLYFEYFSKGGSDSVFQNNAVYSSYLKSAIYRVTSTLQKVDNSDTHYAFTMSASELGVDKDLDLQIVAHLYLNEEGFQIEIRNEQITGSARPYLSSIGVANYLGAVGGVDYEFYTVEKTDTVPGDYDYLEIQREMIDGYSFVPDGSGALIRFRDNSVTLSRYSAYVYGSDPSQTVQNYRQWLGEFVPFKTASIPVYGMAHGNNQAAYVAYATSGDEYMYIISTPEENVYNYNSTHAKFNYHYVYNKLYTLDGDNPVPTISEEMNEFDVMMNYNFLAGDGSNGDYPANYVGMAKKYRDHLIEEEILKELTTNLEDIGIRLDFLMADSEDSIVGYQTNVATTTSDVAEILDRVLSLGVKNISSGLMGWQKDGLTLGDPSKATFSSQIGSKRAYQKLIQDYLAKGIDISLYQDYYTINEEQISLYRNAAKHPAGWYGRYFTFEEPIYLFYYARPEKSVLWLENQSDTFLDMGVGSLTIDGISKNLITDYTIDKFSRTDAINLYQQTYAAFNDEVKLNMVKPNQYLFEYVDRYLLMNVYSTQYLIETDTVPFLQLVLQNTMELYAIYSNFSFYTQTDILRMIDYNVYPSFVLTKQPSQILTDTNSNEFYSTEYQLYEDLIVSTYESVNNTLGEVVGVNWVNREVLEPGVVKNTYENGVIIIINYTDEAYTYDANTVAPLSAFVAGGDS